MVFFARLDFADVTALTLPASASILSPWRGPWCVAGAGVGTNGLMVPAKCCVVSPYVMWADPHLLPHRSHNTNTNTSSLLNTLNTDTCYINYEFFSTCPHNQKPILIKTIWVKRVKSKNRKFPKFSFFYAVTMRLSLYKIYLCQIK